MVQVRQPETRDAALMRLAVGARERGIRPLRHEPTNEYYVESQSEPGTLHRVTAVSCTCKGFQYRGYCCHLAALLDHLGWLPESPTPPPAGIVVRVAEAPCADCRGDGWWYGSATDSRHTVISCGTCRGTGVEIDTLIAA